jgi:hypothetical protein
MKFLVVACFLNEEEHLPRLGVVAAAAATSRRRTSAPPAGEQRAVMRAAIVSRRGLGAMSENDDPAGTP